MKTERCGSGSPRLWKPPGDCSPVQDVEEAMRASTFNKGLGPDSFDGTILQPGNPAHRLTQTITGQILGLLGNPQKIPKYLYEGRLVPLSKNKG